MKHYLLIVVLCIFNIGHTQDCTYTFIGVVKDFQGKTRAGFTLEGEINRKDFGLTWNKALEFGGVAVGDKVKMLIELETVAK